MIHGADIDIRSAVGGADLAAALTRAVTGGPFEVAEVQAAGPDRHRCTFLPKSAGLCVGYGNVLDLQHRVTRDFEIIRVECHAALAS